MTARNERPFRAKQAAAERVERPAAEDRSMTRARLNWMELRATAFGRSSLSTSVGTRA